MLSTRAAHTLLASAHTPGGLAALARALGFAASGQALSARAVRGLDVPALEPLAVTRITRGDHALLTVDQLHPALWRDTLRRLAVRLDRLADPRRWVIVVRCANGGPVVIACWLSAPREPHLAMLCTSPDHVLDSDAQTVAALASAWLPDPTLTALRRHELLGRHAIGKRFFRALDTDVRTIADAWPARVDEPDRRPLALIHVARLLFLKFLETKGWLDNDRTFLARHAEAITAGPGGLWQRLLAPLTFGTLNTRMRHRAPMARAFGAVPFLNGGLFAPTATERRARHPSVGDDALATLILDTLARYRFTAREDATTWSEAAVDPDLLGRTFESLMDAGERKGSGTFYTPGALVSTLVDDALRHAIRAPQALVHAALHGDTLQAPEAATVLRAITDLRILDPACGSGSLLVACLERLATLRRQLGDARAVATVRRDILTRSIFGVDIAPMAVWLCELRLWLSIVIDDDSTDIARITPLPNLDHHVRIGDALSDTAFDRAVPAKARSIAALRERYARASGARKRALALRIDQAERRNAVHVASAAITSLQHERAELLRLARQRTLFGTRAGASATDRRRLDMLRGRLAELRRTLRRLDDGSVPDFDFRSHFSDAALAGGFDLVIGNPPWVRPHHLDADTRARLRQHFAAVSRHTTPGTAFGVQTDIAIPFTHRGLALTRPGGILAFMLPAKLWRSVAAGALREHLLHNAQPLQIRDFSETAGGFAAAVYPSTIILRHAPARAGSPPTMHSEPVECHTTDAEGTPHAFTIAAQALPASPVAGAAWRIVPDAVRLAADALTAAGNRWSDTIIPPPSLGIKTGCNDAFLLEDLSSLDELAPWVRPALRGENLRPWHTTDHTTHIIVPCDRHGETLGRLPAALSRHFAPHRRTLTARTDLRPREPWWSLFRTELLDASGWRVVWADIGRTLRATLLAPGSAAVPLNTCYGVRLSDPIDAHALTALLNAPTTTAWLSLVAEPARGGFHRFLGWTVLSLPIPPWHRARELLAPIAARARRGEAVSADALHDATLGAYGVSHAQIAPLLAWTGTLLRAERERQQRAS